MKKASLCRLAAALTAVCRLALAAPEKTVVNGKVFTADATKPASQAIAIENGRISTVGTDAEVRALAGPATRIVNADGRRVVPGLTEAHVHLGSALPMFAPPVKPIAMPGQPFPGPTPEQALQKVHEAAQGPGDWITGIIGPAVACDLRNWLAALDQAAGSPPTMLRGFWGHALLLNTAALARLGINDDVVVRLADGGAVTVRVISTTRRTRTPNTSDGVASRPWCRNALHKFWGARPRATRAGASPAST